MERRQREHGGEEEEEGLGHVTVPIHISKEVWQELLLATKVSPGCVCVWAQLNEQLVFLAKDPWHREGPVTRILPVKKKKKKVRSL